MILVTGASGFVGGKICSTCKNTVASPSLKGASQEDIYRIVEESKADVIVHTAAISDVRACEADPEASYRANVQLPVFLAKAAKGRKLICFSSDQVYGGSPEEGPYTEDMARPNNTYAKHKLEMEQRVLDLCPDSVLLRAEWMYDYYLKKGNYFMNVLTAKAPLRFSSRNYRGLTYVKEVAETIERTFSLPGGVYNFGSETTKSMYCITKEFLKILGKDIDVEDLSPAHNLWINCGKAQQHGIFFQSVEDGLRSCARDHGYCSI